MTDTVIRVENLGKKYLIGHENQESYTSLRETISNSVIGIGNNIKKIFKNDILNAGNNKIEEFWALDDISFELKRGETLGIIGRNGAGKSTLLKILSRVTEPTKGRIEINGRLASLLEVGTGFHPELTGRENIFLNGAILGMSRSEIKQKFDEIVDFSGVEKFLDTPVKRYSSGMYVRLAFAVAAHLESEILIVDEVLAVGDSEFQKKCLGKMNDVATGEGRTVIFVSHNMNAAKNICSRGILLENGKIKIDSHINTVIDKYINFLGTQESFTPIKIKELGILISKITLNTDNSGVISPFEPLKIDIELYGEYDTHELGFEIMISHQDTDGLVFATNSKTRKNISFIIKKGGNTITCLIHSVNLCSGKYTLGFGISLELIQYYYYNLSVLSFDINEIIVSPSLLPNSPAYGHVYLEHEWINSYNP